MATINDLEIKIKELEADLIDARDMAGGTVIKDTDITMNLQADGATMLLAEALMEQAKANSDASVAMRTLAQSLKPVDVAGIKISNDNISKII